MSKGAVLDEQLLATAGMAEQLLTLAGPVENRHHAVLQEPMFIFKVEEIQEPVHLERKYVYDNQVSIKASYGAGDKILVWLARSRRTVPGDSRAPPIDLLIARDLFLLGDWREFQRFKQFIKSMRILDAQARQWLTDHHPQFEAMASQPVEVERILDCLGNIAEWPEVDTGAAASAANRQNGLEGIAKTFSRSLAHVRSAAATPILLLRRPPDLRFNLFRLFSFVEDPDRGAISLVHFLVGLGQATKDPDLVESVKSLKTSRDLSRAFAAIRRYLISPKMPG